MHPVFTELFLFKGSNSGSKEELANDCQLIMARAESFLDSLLRSVENNDDDKISRTVTVATIRLLQEHADQFLKLGGTHQKNQNVPVSIKESFQQRIIEQKGFFALEEKLKCFIDFTNIFTSGI